VLYNLFSFFLIFFFARDESSIKSMVYGFIAASAVSGFIALQMLTDPVQYLLEDPDFRFRGLSGINYLTFAVPFALSCIFALVRVLVARHTAEKIVMGLVTIFLMFCLVLTGARQSVLGMAIALLIIVTWALQTKRLSLWLLLLIVGASISMAWVLYTSTALSDRWAAASGDYQIRTEYWVEAWHTFLRSPVWGSGFEYWQIGWAHNLLLDVLASQGVIGLAFLIGFLVFTLSAARGTWRVAGSAEIAAWRLGALAALVYTVVQTSFSGGLAGFPHFFWIPALIWRLGAMMHQDDKYQITPNVTSYEHLATEQVALHPR
jgi:O-antigen ligase